MYNKLAVGGGTLWFAERWSDEHGIWHVAVVDVVPSFTEPDGDPWLSTVYDFSEKHGLRTYLRAAGSSLLLRRAAVDQQAARVRLQNVLARGEAYRVLFNNCEHMAYFVIDGERKSPQVHGFVFGAVCLGTFAFIASRPSHHTPG